MEAIHEKDEAQREKKDTHTCTHTYTHTQRERERETDRQTRRHTQGERERERETMSMIDRHAMIPNGHFAKHVVLSVTGGAEQGVYRVTCSNRSRGRLHVAPVQTPQRVNH